jgi:predicted Zn-dependent peptidase
MIAYNRWELENGLRVIFYKTHGRTQATVNVLYNVGARDENENRTGFAHLFEHLMFSGSANVPSYDAIVENAGGSNNAYTTNDITNYYIKLPTENLETALWLESDRMMDLNISHNSLAVQKGVVVEEFKQRCYNSSFGLLWHDARKLMYKKHPYRWPTIGLNFEHIETASLDDVKAFYNKFYNPNNAILCVAADIEVDECKIMVSKWFKDIKNLAQPNRNIYPMETENVDTEVFRGEDLTPHNSVILNWRLDSILSKEYLELSSFAEMFSDGHKSYLIKKLIKESEMFNSASMFISSGMDYSQGLYYGILNEGVSHEEGHAKMIEVLNEAMTVDVLTEKDLKTYKNMYLYDVEKEKLKPSNIAEHLCKYENYGDIELINKWEGKHLELELEQIINRAKATLVSETMSTIYYSPKK